MATEASRLSEFAAACYVAAFGDGFSADDLAAHLERYLAPDRVAQYLRDDNILIAEENGALVGFVQFGAGDEPSEVEIRRLYVLPAKHNQGIGSALLRAALDAPSVDVARRILIDVWEDNAGAQRLYSRFGFGIVDRRPFRVASGAVTGYDLIMELRPSGK